MPNLRQSPTVRAHASVIADWMFDRTINERSLTDDSVWERVTTEFPGLTTEAAEFVFNLAFIMWEDKLAARRERDHLDATVKEFEQLVANYHGRVPVHLYVNQMKAVVKVLRSAGYGN